MRSDRADIAELVLECESQAASQQTRVDQMRVTDTPADTVDAEQAVADELWARADDLRDQRSDGNVARLRRRPVTPDDLETGNVQYVPGGALLAGRQADALVVVDLDEHRRRISVGLGAITKLSALASLMTLPEGFAIDATLLTERAQDHLRDLPAGAVEWLDHGQLMRICRPPLRVVGVAATGRKWRACLDRLSPFGPVCQRIVVLDDRRTGTVTPMLWEAEVVGAGVWLRGSGRVQVLLDPDPVIPRLRTAAQWRVEENAYAAWISAAAIRSGSASGESGHQAHTDSEGSDQLPLVWPAS